jgi:hypothetical protein
MKKLKQLISAVSLLIFASAAVAQTETTPNLVYTTVNPAPTGTNIGQNWTGFSSVTSTGGNTTSDNGAVTGYNPNTGVFMFGYNQGTITYTYAINQALANSGSGIQVQGYNWSWDINNLNYDDRQGSIDTLTARIITFGANNSTILQQDSWTYNTKFDWTTFSGTVNYTNPGLVSEYGNMRIEFSGRDVGFWAGYYGPMVRNIDVRLRYGVDPCVSNPQSSPSCPGYRTYYTFTDDSYVHVPLPFGFPFYGQVFTNSWMHSNGVVSFLNPTAPINGVTNAGQGAYCCGGPDLSQNTTHFGAQFNYIIAPLWTDLYPVAASQFYTTQDSSYIRYHWDNVAEISNMNNLNTFSLELRPTGYYGIQHSSINIQNQHVTVGAIGNLQLDEKNHHYFGIPSSTTGSWSVNSTQATDCSNPLNNINCPGYQQAYFDQQCSINPLYNNTCPGYATAFYNYQCSVSALYHSGCPGYAQAYFDQQCSLNALYNENCPGYAQAYFNQQCVLDPLHNNQCPGYADAFYVQQCTEDPLYDSGCTGYAQAYFDQQCSLDPLYNNQCPGYDTAYFNQQCGISALYNENCPGYAQSYFNQQCSLDPLYDNTCPGYAEAYAKKFILGIGSTPVAASNTPVEETVVAVAVPKEETAKTTELVAEEKIVVAQAETKTAAVSTSPASEATAPVSLTSSRETPAAAAVKAETKTEAPARTTAAPARTAPTTRQALAEQRMAAAREQAAQAARENPGAVTEAIDSATSMEQQVEVQNVVLGAMGFVPGFDAYGRAVVPDAAFYPPVVLYPGQQNIDTPAARGLLGRSDRLHQEMVDAQYK